MDRVEAAGCPALVLHRIPSCRPEAAPGWLDGSGDVQPDIDASVPRGPLAQQMRAASVAHLPLWPSHADLTDFAQVSAGPSAGFCEPLQRLGHLAIEHVR